MDAVMATKFSSTNIPNLDYAESYGTYYGRVKLHGKLVREVLGKNQRAAQAKLSGWLASKRGAKKTKKGTLNALSER